LESKSGGITWSHDVFGLGMITEEGIRENHKIIYDIDAHSTKEFFVEIDAMKCQKKSIVSFDIVRTAKEPADIVSFDPFKSCQNDQLDFKTYHETSKMMLNQRRYKEALVCCEKAIDKDPSAAKVYSNMGIAYLFLNERDEATTKFREAIKIDPHLPKPYLNLAGVLMQDGNTSEAIELLKTVSSMEVPEQSDAYALWGQCLAIQGDSSGAIEKYNEALKLNPEYGPAYFRWGLLLKNNGDCDQAIEKFKEATRYNHAFQLDAYGMWGGCLENMGRYQEAIGLYQIIIDKAPNSDAAKKSELSIESAKKELAAEKAS